MYDYTALFNLQYIYNKSCINLDFIPVLAAFIFLQSRAFKTRKVFTPKNVLTKLDRGSDSLTCHKTIVKAGPENHINTLFNGFSALRGTN